MTVTRLVTGTEITAAVVVAISALALVLMIPAAISAFLWQGAHTGERRHHAWMRRRAEERVQRMVAEETLQRMLAASADMSIAAAKVDRLALHAIVKLPEGQAAAFLRRTALQLTAGAEALTAAEAADEGDD